MKHGFQLSFFTQQNKRHKGRTLGAWLVEEARGLGIDGATLLTAAEGFGHRHRIHAAHFFELSDQPVEVIMAVTPEESDRLLRRIREEHLNVFYVKVPVEYGTTLDDPL